MYGDRLAVRLAHHLKNSQLLASFGSQ